MLSKLIERNQIIYTACILKLIVRLLCAGRVPSLALLEEARIWSALLLRLTHKLSIWASHVPQLARVVLELVPEVVASLTYMLNLWGSDTAAFERRLQPVSEQETQQSRTVKDINGGERPVDTATSVLDEPIRTAIRDLSATASKDSRSRHKLEHQRCMYHQRLLDTMLVVLHNCLRIMCACGDQVRPYIERSMSRFGTTVAPLQEWQAANSAVAPRRSGCSLGTLIASAEAAISYLSFVVHVDRACDGADTGEKNGRGRGGEWLEEVGALQHRRAMLLRLIECAGLLLGRFAGDVDVSDPCDELLLRLRQTCSLPPQQEAQGRSSARARRREVELERTLSLLRGAMRTIHEYL